MNSVLNDNQGSLFKVPVTTIRSIRPHSNAERLEIASIYGFDVVVQKNKYHVGSVVIYCPIDAILPIELEKELFPEDAKIKLTNGRIRQIKIRGFPSAGMLIPLEVVSKYGINEDNLVLEMDLAPILGITKYTPPLPKENTGPKKRDKPKENLLFHKYDGVSNLKWSPDIFQDKEVIIQLKLHGSNIRCGYLPSSANTVWKKIKKLFGLLPKYEYVWGSNNVQLQHRAQFKGYYGEDIYKKCLHRVNAFQKLKPGETIYGEMIGEGIQAQYHYGHKQHHFVLFDVKILQEDGTQKWLDPEEAEAFAKERGFDFVPILYRGIWNKEVAESLSVGPDPYFPEHTREGVVVKARTNYSIEGNKQAYKIISTIYLSDYKNTDNQ